ncbi:helix-turn-helix domain-containing protein [Mycobacterium riyadhense]|uniref:helix-turn-helix domain-containing protein n=1 Tax=Mycobacterium riyadhense TaxID=486698 RepID=UPI0019524A66|nr:helix-turn-helix domain-containing protein [Mycobacterium riyadhense]
MTSRGRPTAGLGLTKEEHQTLTRWPRRRKSSPSAGVAVADRVGCAQGLSNAARERVSPSAVGKWRRRFVEARLDGLVDNPRPGRPATVSTKQVEDAGFVVTRREARDAPTFSGFGGSEYDAT